VPSSPQNLRGTEVDATYITLSWDSPASDGGSALTGYVIEKRDMKRADYVFLANVDATTMSYKATRLFEGSEYLFRVFAENQAGLSRPCELDKPITARMPYGQSAFRCFCISASFQNRLSFILTSCHFQSKFIKNEMSHKVFHILCEVCLCIFCILMTHRFNIFFTSTNCCNY